LSIPAANATFILQEFTKRLGDPYVYGGRYSPTDPSEGCDCSGEVGWVLEGLTKGPAVMSWAHNVSTESWPFDYGSNTPAAPGTVGPYGTIAIRSAADAPADAALIINIEHGGGGASSHMSCYLTATGTYMESNGSHGTCTGAQAYSNTSTLWTDHWYLPGPIDGSVAAVPTTEPRDTVYADVSEFQAKVTNAYTDAGYQWLCIRSNDGTHRDANFPANYAWCKAAVDAGLITGFMVYYYWRPNSTGIATHMAMVNEQGGPHPSMVSMIDLESGGNPGGDQTSIVNSEYSQLQSWLGDPRRVVVYGNSGDLRSMYPGKAASVPVIVAGYGSNPSYPGKVAHQYTDGNGYGGGLPEGAPPFGNCDMNSADGFSPSQLAAFFGLPTTNTDTGDISMADAQSIQNALNGQGDGTHIDPWRKVELLQPYTGVGQVKNDPKTPTQEPWESGSLFDHASVLAKVLTRLTPDGKDIFDLVSEIHAVVTAPKAAAHKKAPPA
jgi:hypothetical protein